ncbi:MAG: phytanoyl-CoA dioxygenase family protein [Gammaproteobacteria bacterium]
MGQTSFPGAESSARPQLPEQILSPEQQAAFHTNGYLVVDFEFDDALLEGIKEKVYPLYPEEFRNNPTFGTRVQDAWLQVDEVRQLAVQENVLRALGELYGRRALAFQTLNFPVGTSQLAHSDTIHFNSMPSGFMAGVWVALEDMDENNGSLIYYPGSHKLHEYTMQDFGLGTGYNFYKDYERAVQQVIEEQNLQPEYGCIRKGEALIWHANLLHGGAPRKDLARSRHSQVTHYYFEGCRYYTPMLSSEGDTHYRDPIWIPETREGVSDVKKRMSAGLLRRILRKLARR